MVAAPAAVCEDGIGHNTRMSKSKMHAELIRKAKSRMAEEDEIRPNDEEGYGPAPPSPVISSPTEPTKPPTLSPPPPPPPPPPPAVPARCRPDTSDGIAHNTAMSKADMHKELIAKSKVKSSKQAAATTGEEVEEKVELEENSAERKALERKKLVQDILRKEEEAGMPPSSSRQANERARRDFFADKDKDLGQAEAEVSKDEKRESFAEEAKEEEVEEKKPSPPSNSQDKKSCTIL